MTASMPARDQGVGTASARRPAAPSSGAARRACCRCRRPAEPTPGKVLGGRGDVRRSARRARTPSRTSRRWSALNENARPWLPDERARERRHVDDGREVHVDPEALQVPARWRDPRWTRRDAAGRARSAVVTGRGGPFGRRLTWPPSWSTAISSGGLPPSARGALERGGERRQLRAADDVGGEQDHRADASPRAADSSHGGAEVPSIPTMIRCPSSFVVRDLRQAAFPARGSEPPPDRASRGAWAAPRAGGVVDAMAAVAANSAADQRQRGEEPADRHRLSGDAERDAVLDDLELLIRSLVRDTAARCRSPRRRDDCADLGLLRGSGGRLERHRRAAPEGSRSASLSDAELRLTCRWCCEQARDVLRARVVETPWPACGERL